MNEITRRHIIILKNLLITDQQQSRLKYLSVFFILVSLHELAVVRHEEVVGTV